MAKSIFMFERGAKALRSAMPRLPHVALHDVRNAELSWPLPEDVYVCPLCLRAFTRADAGRFLTREHVPPKSVGGVVLTTTCIDCNGDASGVQHHAAMRQELNRFAAGEDGATVRLSLQIPSGETVRADVAWNNGAFWAVTDPRYTNPAHMQSLHEKLQGANGETLNFTFKGEPRFEASLARASRFRDAYLAAFSLLGYRYILWPSLDDVRRRIRDQEPPENTFWVTDRLGPGRSVPPCDCVGKKSPAAGMLWGWGEDDRLGAGSRAWSPVLTMLMGG